MDQEREELRREHERGRPRRRERRVEHRLGVPAVPCRAAHQIKLLHELPSRLSREARVVPLRRLRAALRRGHRDAGAGLHDLLRHVRPFARHESLARAVRGHRCATCLGIRTAQLGVGGPQERDPLLHRHSEWVARECRAVLAALRGDGRERDWRRARRGRRRGAPERLVDQAAQRGLACAIRRRKSPGPLRDHTERDATIRRARDRLYLAVAHPDRLVLAFDRTGVRVAGPAGGGEMDEIGERVGHGRSED